VSIYAKTNLRNWRKTFLKRTPRDTENVVNEPNTVEPSSFPITSRSHVSLYPHNWRKGPPVQGTESLWNQHFSRNLLLELYFRVARWKLWGFYPIVSDLLKRKLEQLAVSWDYHIVTGQLWLGTHVPPARYLFAWKRKFFPPVWPIVTERPVKTVTKQTSEWRFLKTSAFRVLVAGR